MDYRRHFSQMLATNSETLFSGRLDRYFRWAAWADVAVFFACLYILYCNYLTLMGRTTALQHLSLRIFLGTIGAIGTLGGMLLSKIMWTFWRQCDTSSRASKRLWFSIMFFVPLFGCAAYYFVIYRNRTGE
jgi:hypothetical protein